MSEVQSLFDKLKDLKTCMNEAVIARAEMHARKSSSARDETVENKIETAASQAIAAYQEARWKLAEALGCSYSDPRLL
jgi:hypothetical protein